MPSIKLEGLDEVYARLRSIAEGDAIEKVQKQAVYAGMREIKNELERQIRALPVQEGYIKGDDLPRNVITRAEQQELIRHIGISDMETTRGTVSNAVGFNGYMNIKTNRYPKGLPAVMVARSINSGSSVRRKHPFVRQARAAAKSRAIQAATDAALKALKELSEG